MSDVQLEIDERQRVLAQHSLFQALDRSADIEDLRAIAPHGYFYVLGFQDMLRLTHELVVDPALREVAHSLRQEDANHDTWFLADAETLGFSRDVAWLFGSEHQPTRDMVYRLMGELLAAGDDRVRLVFPLVLESAGAVFFGSMVALVQRADFDHSLRYFARSHQDVELAHQIFADEGKHVLEAITFEQPLYDQALRLVRGCFDCFQQFADHLERHRAARA